MKKTWIPRLFWAGFLFIILSFPACKSQEPVQAPPPDGEFIDASPRDGELIFFGVAGIRSKMEDSVALALEEAARRVAIFHGVEGSVSTVTRSGGRFLDYRAESNQELVCKTDWEPFVEALEFDENSDVFRSENAIFVRARYPGRLNLDYRPVPPPPGGKPYWIENPPSAIGEYIVGIGYAGRRNAHRDTAIASYENAVFAAIQNLRSVVRGQISDRQGGGFAGQASSSEYEINASGSLSEFYALETWTDPFDKAVWTLAVAKENAR